MASSHGRIVSEHRGPCRWRVLLLAAGPMAMLLILLGLIRFALLVIIVRGQSMAPTLNDGDRVLAVRYWPARWLRKGQLVLICPPQSYREAGQGPFGFVPFVKRIVGLPGETLMVPDVREIELLSLGDQAIAALPQRAWHVPAKHLFVCGDNPRNLADSRFWGPIPQQSVVGIVLMGLSGAIPSD